MKRNEMKWNEWMNEWNECMEWMNGMNEWMIEWMNEWTNEMNEMNEWMKWNEMKWMNEWMKWMNEWKRGNKQIHLIYGHVFFSSIKAEGFFNPHFWPGPRTRGEAPGFQSDDAVPGYSKHLAGRWRVWCLHGSGSAAGWLRRSFFKASVGSLRLTFLRSKLAHLLFHVFPKKTKKTNNIPKLTDSSCSCRLFFFSGSVPNHRRWATQVWQIAVAVAFCLFEASWPISLSQPTQKADGNFK